MIFARSTVEAAFLYYDASCIQHNILQFYCKAISKADESQSRAPGQASDCTLRAPNPLDSCTQEQTFYQDFGFLNQSGPKAFCPPPPHYPPLTSLGYEEVINIICSQLGPKLFNN